jgi:hypothetical protein
MLFISNKILFYTYPISINKVRESEIKLINLKVYQYILTKNLNTQTFLVNLNVFYKP